MAILAIQNPNYQPAMRVITAITQSDPAVITTSFDHNFKDGLIVRIIIAPGFGMKQIDRYKGPITVLSSTTFSLPLDTSGFDAFVVPAMNTPDKYYTWSQVVPVGEINSELIQATRNVL